RYSRSQSRAEAQSIRDTTQTSPHAAPYAPRPTTTSSAQTSPRSPDRECPPGSIRTPRTRPAAPPSPPSPSPDHHGRRNIETASMLQTPPPQRSSEETAPSAQAPQQPSPGPSPLHPQCDPQSPCSH